jgi:membrane protease YdiL (CAAX protease family)
VIDLIKDRYFVAYLIAYSGCIILAIIKGIEVGELMATAIIIGMGFTGLAFLMTRNVQPLFEDRKGSKGEIYWLIILVLFAVFFITFYHRWPLIGDLNNWENERVSELFTGLSKLIFIVGPPLLVYKLVFDFKWNDWGMGYDWKMYNKRSSWGTFLVFVIVISFFQYFMGSGARPLREGLFSVQQVIPGIVLNYIWLILTVGIVEEYFFRVFLQSRLTVLLKSSLGGIVVSAALFGLAHAPGMYLRGGGVIANLGPDPGLLMSVIYSFLVLSVAGFFLSVIWLRTKNFWLIVGIHAMVDLLPNLGGFIELWGV